MLLAYGAVHCSLNYFLRAQLGLYHQKCVLAMKGCIGCKNYGIAETRLRKLLDVVEDRRCSVAQSSESVSSLLVCGRYARKLA